MCAARPARKRKGGRPTKLSTEIRERLCQAIRAGCFVETAVAYVGISKDSFYEWLKRGRREKTGAHRQFADAIEKAIADFEVAAVGRIAKAGTDPKGWFATAWLLERRFPGRWARPEIKAEHFPESDSLRGPKVARMPIAPPPADQRRGD